MRRAGGLLTLALLAACHHQQTRGITLDADDDARNATAAKIDADLQAADAAAARPMPRPAAPVVGPDKAVRPDAADPADGDEQAPAPAPPGNDEG